MSWILIPALVAASSLDWRYRKVPNGLTLPLILTGMIVQTVHGGFVGLRESFFGTCLGIMFLYFPFVFGGVGGGDVKLMGAVGAFTGPLGVFKVFLAAAIFGGAFSLFEMIRQKTWRQRVADLRNHVFHFFLTRQPLLQPVTKPEKSAGQIPYALAIGSGYLWIYFLGGGVSQ